MCLMWFKKNGDTPKDAAARIRMYHVGILIHHNHLLRRCIIIRRYRVAQYTSSAFDHLLGDIDAVVTSSVVALDDRQHSSASVVDRYRCRRILRQVKPDQGCRGKWVRRVLVEGKLRRNIPTIGEFNPQVS